MEGTANAEPWPDHPVCTEAPWQVAAGVSRGSVTPLHFKASFETDITPAGWCFAFILFLHRLERVNQLRGNTVFLDTPPSLAIKST